MSIRLYNADCFDVFAVIPDGTVDLVCADIPYGTTQCRWDSVLDLPRMWSELYRVCKANAAIVLFSAQPFTSMLVSSNLNDWRTEWIWEKGNATGFLNAKKQPLRAHENIQVFYRRQPTYNPQMTDGHIRKTSTRKTVNSECYGKALSLTEYLIETNSHRGDVVLDFTIGSGTAGIACQQTDRSFIGIEKEQDIFEVACMRIGISRKERAA